MFIVLFYDRDIGIETKSFSLDSGFNKFYSMTEI